MAMMEVGLNTLHVELSDSFSCVTAVRVKQMGTVLTCMLPTPPHLHSTFTSSEGRYGGALLNVNTPRLTPIGLVSNLASLVPRPSPAPVFDRLQYAYCKQSKTGAREGILQTIKNWSRGRPGNEAKFT